MGQHKRKEEGLQGVCPPGRWSFGPVYFFGGPLGSPWLVCFSLSGSSCPVMVSSGGGSGRGGPGGGETVWELGEIRIVGVLG